MIYVKCIMISSGNMLSLIEVLNMDFDKIFDDMCNEFCIDRLSGSEYNNNECCIYLDDYENKYDVINEYLNDNIDEDYEIDELYEYDDGTNICRFVVKKLLYRKYISLEKDFKNIQGKIKVDKYGVEIEFLNDFHKLEDILEIVWNRIDKNDIHIQIVDYDKLKIKSVDMVKII